MLTMRIGEYLYHFDDKDFRVSGADQVIAGCILEKIIGKHLGNY
jgi:hypothetical protein